MYSILSYDHLTLIVHASIISRLDYCNATAAACDIISKVLNGLFLSLKVPSIGPHLRHNGIVPFQRRCTCQQNDCCYLETARSFVHQVMFGVNSCFKMFYSQIAMNMNVVSQVLSHMVCLLGEACSSGTQ